MIEDTSGKRLIFLCKYLLSIFILNLIVYIAAAVFFASVAESFSAAALLGYSLAFSILFTTAAATCLINVYRKYYRNYLHRIASFFVVPSIMVFKILVSVYDTPLFYILLSSCTASLFLIVFYFYKFRQFLPSSS